MKIGIISTIEGGYSWAGSEEMWYLLAHESLSNGNYVRVNVTTTIAQSSQAVFLKSQGAKVEARLALNGITRRLAAKGLYSRQGLKEYSGEDVICLSMGAIADCVWIPDLLRAFRSSQVPWIVIVQGNGEHIIGDENQRIILRDFYRRVQKVIFVSQQNLELAERQLAIRFDNAVVMPNPIREVLNAPLDWPASDQGTYRMAEIARLEVLQKRQDHLLEALSTPEWKQRNWTLTFYGVGPDKEHILALIRHYGLEGKALLGGYVRDFKEIWTNNHIHLLPTSYEGLSLSLLESMSCGRPAVVTRAGGNADLVRDEVDGYVSPGMHPEVIRDRLEYAWANRDGWMQMGLNAWERSRSWVPDDLGNELLHMIIDVVKHASKML
ncbi:MAG: glycosyltransferase family 4 protein [Cyanothece sp. SIO1E1]|nr:glycosyltransferase family 4 protein [Cyanothece sp. SIO1E1]